MKQTHIILIIVIILLVVAVILFKSPKSNTIPVPTPPTQVDPEVPVVIDERIKNLSLSNGSTLMGSVIITGDASGLYFEASFPIIIKDQSNQVVHTFIATAQSDWMTTDFVAFKAPLDTTKIPNGNYTFEFTQDDPSGGESGKPIYMLAVPVTIAN